MINNVKQQHGRDISCIHEGETEEKVGGRGGGGGGDGRRGMRGNERGGGNCSKVEKGVRRR